MYELDIISDWNVGIDIFTDSPCELYIDKFPITSKDTLKVFWAVEPNYVSMLQEVLIERCEEFDLILTWQKEILDSCPNSKLFPFGTSWIKDFDFSKKKEYSITSVVGGKKITNNQIIRQELPKIINELKSIKLDLFNSKNRPYRGTPKINRTMVNNNIKNEVFYSQFHIAIENISLENWFTEKLIDCFQTKTVPIYMGCPNIEEFFDVRGIIIVNNIEDIINVCNSLKSETYNQMLPYIEENYKRSFKYVNFRESLRDEIIEFVKNY